MGRDGRSVLGQFAVAAVAAALLWFGATWLAPHVIRGLMGGW
ncbi:hypothetical protein [Streptomyces sp. NRRL F-5123]|nr:hypothetical protein [Streptomyces sp. NRRL F-5123]